MSPYKNPPDITAQDILIQPSELNVISGATASAVFLYFADFNYCIVSVFFTKRFLLYARTRVYFSGKCSNQSIVVIRPRCNGKIVDLIVL